MTVVNPKSISGITSITTASDSDDLLTIHTNNGTERLRIDSTGATKIVTGIVTTLTATTGIVTTLTANTVTSLGAVSGTTGTFTSSLTINTTTDQMLNLNSTDDGGTYIGYQRSGTRTAYLGHGGTGSTFTLRNEIENGNVDIRGNDGGSYVTMLNLNTGDGGTATFSSDLIIPDKIVHSGDTNTAIRFPSADTVTVETGGSERLRITSAGKVNIGDTQMSSNLLNIEDGTAAAIDLASHGSGGDTAYIGVKKSTGGGLTFGISNRDIIFKTGASYSSGTTFDSGNEKLRLLAAGGLTFNGDTAAANALDDYEIGTWTPTFRGDSSDPTQSYATQNGLYVKVGNLVYCDFDLQCASSGISAGGGYFRIGNLPFAKDSSLQTYGISSSFGFSTNLSTSHPTAAYGSAATSTIYLMSPDKSNGVVYGNAAHVTNSSRVLGGFTYRTHQ